MVVAWWIGRFHRPPLVALCVLLLVTSSEANVRLCGQRLTSTLLAICRNQVCGGLTAFKRASPWAPSTLQLFGVHHTSKRGGIATECCEKRCSFSYLKTYCCNE